MKPTAIVNVTSEFFVAQHAHFIPQNLFKHVSRIIQTLIFKKLFDEFNEVFEKLDFDEFVFEDTNEFGVVGGESVLKPLVAKTVQRDVLGLGGNICAVSVLAELHGGAVVLEWVEVV
jgi:hypothetical protein